MQHEVDSESVGFYIARDEQTTGACVQDASAWLIAKDPHFKKKGLHCRWGSAGL
jgi:hypothetical protein